MGELAIKSMDGSETEHGKSTNEKIERTLTSEFVIGICSTIGSSRDEVVNTIEKQLKNKYKYDVIKISLSEFILKYSTKKSTKNQGETEGYTEIMNKIMGGDELRQKYGNDFLINLSIQKINNDRREFHNTKEGREVDPKDFESRRVCYIINSLKNKEELKLLRSVYREMFYLFSIFTPNHEREDNLREKNKISPDEILKVINTDQYEDDDNGQNVRNTFIEGDFFVRVSKKKGDDGKPQIDLNEIDLKISRYLHLVFESDIITPLKNEIAMYQAKSAASNSSCLSRQVGAAITDKDGNILSKGWNDVPKFGGNLYTEDDGKKDSRCFKMNKYCSNDKEKGKVTDGIIEKIKSDEQLNAILDLNKIDNSDKFLERLSTIVRDSRIKDLIEFSRSVHAEMHAIINGSQLTGTKMKGGKLFTTTYPCHNCARHIIAAGISEIYYIEPYVKSLGSKLHEDAITDKEIDDDEKVKILIYDGVAPRRFLEFFVMNNKRKEHGVKLSINNITQVPKSRLTLQALTTLEDQATHSLTESGFKIP